MTSRKLLLKSSAACIALPFLESIATEKTRTLSSIQKVPKRVIFLGTGFGVTGPHWYPDINQKGYKYKLSKCLTPLNKFKNDITVFQNLEHANSHDGHSGSTFWLTGADRYAIPGRSFSNTISVDQVVAETFGQHTRYTSINLDGGSDLSGHGPGSMSWNKLGKPVAALKSPISFYNKLFSNESMSIEESQYLLKDQRSALDTVIADANFVKKGLIKSDLDKLDEYFESIREIEKRISKEEKWLHIPKKKPTLKIKEPSSSLEGVKEIEVNYDLMIAAMQVDATRAFTYRLPSDSFMRSLGSSYTAHNLSHFTGEERTRDSIIRDQTHAKLLAQFIEKLKSFKEPDGTSIFDNVAITLGSNLRVTHSLNNCPTLITGGGAGFKHGRHMVMEDKTPLCNLWLSILKGIGVKTDSFGDSTDTIKSLYTA